jgi:hypothetical protein
MADFCRKSFAFLEEDMEDRYSLGILGEHENAVEGDPDELVRATFVQ